MTTKALSFQAPLSLAIAEGATTPNPGNVGVSLWSSTLGAVVCWNGSKWSAEEPPIRSAPTFTYTSGVLTRIDYSDGFYKVFAYSGGGDLSTITTPSYVKTFNYDGSGVLTSITQV